MFKKQFLTSLTRSAVGLSLLIFIGGCQYFRPGGSMYHRQEVPVNDNVDRNHAISSTHAVINHPFYVLDKRAPAEVAVGQTFTYEYVFSSRVDAKDVIVEEMLAQGLTYVSSTPEATVEGNKIVWHVPAIQAGECLDFTLSVKASESTCVTSCASAMLIPVACTTTLVGEPLLTITKECAGRGDCLAGDEVSFDIFVKNTGNYPAHDVVITDIVPEGMMHCSGKKELKMEIGTLCPGECRSTHIKLIACDGGEYCNLARVTSSNTAAQEAKACCKVVKPGLAIEKTGTKEQFIGHEAHYKIKVSNVGDVDLTDVLVTDTIPPYSTLMQAPEGEVRGRNVHWQIDVLKAGESKTFDVSIQGCSIGDYCNQAAASLCNGDLLVRDSISTSWKGYPALCLEAIDTCDPIMCGDETEYIVEVANTGTAADHNIKLVAELSEHLEAVDTNGPSEAHISGKTIEFSPVPALEAQNTMVFRIYAKAVKQGSARISIKLSSDLLEQPIIEEESTQVY